MENSNTVITEWKTNLEKKFEIFQSNFLRRIQILELQSGGQI